MDRRTFVLTSFGFLGVAFTGYSSAAPAPPQGMTPIYGTPFHEVTVFFAQNPIAVSPLSAFVIWLDSNGFDYEDLQVTAIYD